MLHDRAVWWRSCRKPNHQDHPVFSDFKYKTTASKHSCSYSSLRALPSWRTHNFEKSELSKYFLSRNYEPESCSYESFLLGIRKRWKLLHSWGLVSSNLQAVRMSFPTSIPSQSMYKVGENKWKRVRACKAQTATWTSLLQFQAWVAPGSVLLEWPSNIHATF